MQINNKLHFQSGLNRKIEKEVKNINIKSLEDNFYKKYKIDAFFMEDNSQGFCNYIASNIFYNLSNKLNIKLSFPPSIRCYITKPKIHTNHNFCIATNTKVFDNELPFEARSIFFLRHNSIEELNNSIELRFTNKEISSSHFLADTIHEWMHSIHLGLIYEKYEYFEGTKKIKELQKFEINKQTQNIIYDLISKYPLDSKNIVFELFAEIFTQIICKSLNSNLELIKNPIDILKSYPIELKKILKIACFNN